MSEDKDFLNNHEVEHFRLICAQVNAEKGFSVFISLSEIPEIISRAEVVDIPRAAFNLFALASYVSRYPDTTESGRVLVENVFTFINNQKQEHAGSSRVFIDLYLLQTALLLGYDNSITNQLARDFISSITKLPNIYNNPLLANKVIIFYESHKDVLDLSALERVVGNLKSVLLYLISSNVSEGEPFFYFADMLFWTKGLACEEKVLRYVLDRIKRSDLSLVSSSGLAYVVECFARARKILPKGIISAISGCKLLKEQGYITMRSIPFGLYLNTKLENTVCLDTNAHLLLASLEQNKHV